MTYSLVSGNALVAFLAVGFGMVVVSLLKTRVDGVLADERQISVSEKASQKFADSTGEFTDILS